MHHGLHRVLWIELSPAFLEKLARRAARRYARPRGPHCRARGAFPVVLALGLLLPMMHQSSLGSLFSWPTEAPPAVAHAAAAVLFLLACVSMGYAVVVSSRSSPRWRSSGRSRRRCWRAWSGIMAFLRRLVVMRWRTSPPRPERPAFAADGHALLFWLENRAPCAGVMLLSASAARDHTGALVGAAAMLVAAGALYRFDVYLVAFDPGRVALLPVGRRTAHHARSGARDRWCTSSSCGSSRSWRRRAARRSPLGRAEGRRRHEPANHHRSDHPHRGAPAHRRRGRRRRGDEGVVVRHRCGAASSGSCRAATRATPGSSPSASAASAPPCTRSPRCAPSRTRSSLEIPLNAQYIRNMIVARARAARPHRPLLPAVRARLGRRRLGAQGAIRRRRRRSPRALADWPGNSPKQLQAVKDRLDGFVDSGQLGIFTNGYWGHPAMKLSPEVNLLAVSHYLQALDYQRKAQPGRRDPRRQDAATSRTSRSAAWPTPSTSTTRRR